MPATARNASAVLPPNKGEKTKAIDRLCREMVSIVPAERIKKRKKALLKTDNKV